MSEQTKHKTQKYALKLLHYAVVVQAVRQAWGTMLICILNNAKD